MRRRDFLKFLLGTAAASYIDYEQLLWIPGEKTIFIPPVHKPFKFLTQSEIISIELERITPHLKRLFEQDDLFYQRITSREKSEISNRGIRLPLNLTPGVVVT